MSDSSHGLLDDHTLAELDRAWSTWNTSDQRQYAIHTSVAVHGYNADDIEWQLERIAQRCCSMALRSCAASEKLHERTTVHAPTRILHVAASTIPGLLVESICHSLALGSDVLVRPSSRETVFEAWRAHLASIASPLLERIEICSSIPDSGFDAAVVFGTDATVELVRKHLEVSAGSQAPLAAYGTRVGIALIDATAIASDSDWVTSLCDDVGMFLQRGCMSPSQVMVVGSRTDNAHDTLRSMLQHALRSSWVRHRSNDDGVHVKMQERRMSDAATLDQLFDQISEHEIVAGPLRLHLSWYRDDEAARDALETHRSTMQTTVVVAHNRRRWNELAKMARDVGGTRSCLPGTAHDQPADWPHDGIGWFTPLMQPQASLPRI